MVANYQVLYGKATLATAAPNAAEAADQVARISDALGLDLTALPEPEGLTFKRAQLLEFNGRPLVQIAYVDGEGTPIALCILSSDKPASDSVDLAALQGLGSASWNSDGFGFLLIGGDDPKALENSADTFKSFTNSAT